MFGRAISRLSAIRKARCRTFVVKKFNQGSNDNWSKTMSNELSSSVLGAIKKIANEKGFYNYSLETKPLSAVGENSYGLVVQTKLIPQNETPNEFSCVIKIAPQNAARRSQMRVADFYERETFMYKRVLKEFREIQQEENIPPAFVFDAVPKFYFASLKNFEEFIIIEDLSESGYLQNSRKNMPSFELTASALKTLAKFHAMSFVMQIKKPQVFQNLINEIRDRDNLYTPTMDELSIEFAKKYLRWTKDMIAEDNNRYDREELLQVVQLFEDKFKNIALKAVNGGKCAPYSVICHGDFWNNNILYRYDDNMKPSFSKLIDFQMSRYASPVLDVVHYLFACTEKELRDAHFSQLLQIYYDSLTTHLQLFHLDPQKIFPRNVFDKHLKTYGPYGFCMATFSIPFFISDSVDLPDFDKVSEAVSDIYSDDSNTNRGNLKESDSILRRKKEVLSEFELLTEKTIPVFRRRMIGVVMDLVKYDMVRELKEFCNQN